MRTIYPCKTIKGVFGVDLDGASIRELYFPGCWDMKRGSEDTVAIVDKLAKDLNEYFTGLKVDWKSYKLSLNGTPFQQRVWKTLRSIPYGKTASYQDVALRLESKGVRAVGNACADNRIPIIIPCHRVIRNNGGLGGFGAGLQWKHFLLELESGHKGNKNKLSS